MDLQQGFWVGPDKPEGFPPSGLFQRTQCESENAGQFSLWAGGFSTKGNDNNEELTQT